MIRQPYNSHHLDNNLLDDLYEDPVPIIMDPLQGDLTNVQSPFAAARDEDVHPGGLKDPHGTAPTPGANLVTATILDTGIVRALLLSGPPPLNDEMTDNHLSTINHVTTPPISQLSRLLRGGRANIPPITTTQRMIPIILSNLPAPSGNPGASGRTTPRIPLPSINLHGKIPRNLPTAMTPPTILPQNHLQHSPPPSQHQHATRRTSLTIQEMTNLNSQNPSLQDICSSISGMGQKQSGSGESDSVFATQTE